MDNVLEGQRNAMGVTQFALRGRLLMRTANIRTIGISLFNVI
jgi:hypothetical protein